VLSDTDPGPFQGCSDVYVKAKVTSSTGQVREKKTGNKTKCPVGNIFVGTILNLTNTSTNKITTGPFTFQYWVKDDDDGPFNDDDTMNSGTQFNVACNGVAQVFTDLAGAGDSADIRIRVRCTPIAHAGGASELKTHNALNSNVETLKLELFDVGGRKVLELENQNLSAFAAQAQGRLANGIYLYVQTMIVQGQIQKKLGKAIVLPSGSVEISPSQESESKVNETSTVEPQAVLVRRWCPSAVPTIAGGAGPDLLLGTPGADVIYGRAGNDSINGLAGNDLICGGLGNDKIVDGPGSDVIYGDFGNDRVYLVADATLDGVKSGPGNDHIELAQGTGQSVINCGPGVDTVRLNGNPLALVSLTDCEVVIP
jgi:Ca2+-binding RTX toxin-like protein